ncbi:hypothetical protein QYF36_009631 [Acer negundo]|nr:hypothetical protein QYF36_009631 [Acer negundo]
MSKGSTSGCPTTKTFCNISNLLLQTELADLEAKTEQETLLATEAHVYSLDKAWLQRIQPLSVSLLYSIVFSFSFSLAVFYFESVAQEKFLLAACLLYRFVFVFLWCYYYDFQELVSSLGSSTDKPVPVKVKVDKERFCLRKQSDEEAEASDDEDVFELDDAKFPISLLHDKKEIVS